jgi:hypothetical protein
MTTVSLPTTRIMTELPEVIARFQEDQKRREPDTPTRIITQSGAHYYGIHKDSQEKPSALLDLREIVRLTLKISPEGLVIQVIGDSRPFSKKGTEAGYRFIKAAFRANDYVLYGYTGLHTKDGSKCVNALTSSYLQDHGLLDKAIGNVVGYQTRSALSGKCDGPDLSHYVVVYGDDESSAKKGTLFGDDIATSDHLADRFLLLEGGIQSFAQACNALAMGKFISGLSGIRHSSSSSFFSATEFLNFLQSNLASIPPEEATEEFLTFLKDQYIREHSPADPSGKYYEQKMRLFDASWTFFLENRLHENLHLLRTFTPAEI